MAHRQHHGGNRKQVLLPPINFIFRLLLNRDLVKIWLFEQVNIQIEGRLRGFDEYMNLVIDDAVEIHLETKDNEEYRRKLGRTLLKGDNVTLIQQVPDSGESKS